MSQLNLHVSNRLDLLAAALAEVTAQPLASPFTPETVIVQSVATRRWLSLKLAELTGICANFAFPFLGEVVEQLVANASQTLWAAVRPAGDLLTWRIESALRRGASGPEFAGVARYLAGGDPLKRFALARRLANLFDQYRVFRPELLLKWVAGKTRVLTGNEAWQAKLWLDIDGASEFDRVLAHLRLNGFHRAAPTNLPARLSIFAPTAIAPAYLDLLLQLARVSEVHLFLLQPTPAYYGDSLTPKARAALRVDPPVEELGNPLLASWGRADLELTDLLIEAQERLGTATRAASENFQETPATDLLTSLQRDLFLAAPAGVPPGETKQPVKADDRSLVLNSCHSPMREVEVLYDQLLACFADDPHLRPRDILVMTPEIEKYGPLIHAVFGYPENEARRIPYAIADRHPRGESVPIDTFLTLLGLAGTRYAAPDIFRLLSSRVLRQRFAFTDEDLSLLRAWIDETGIRWGIDADHRASQGVPALAANTWRQGLQRLLLGFALEGHQRELFAGILPEDNVEGDGAETLGRFITAVEALFAIETDFADARPLASWADPLLAFLTDFFEPAPEADASDVRHMRVIIERLRVLGASTPPEEAVEFPVIRQFLEDQVGAMEQRGSFLTGGVTFCALKPVRGIPAKVICLLGLNDQAFPRRPRLAEFDLMSDRRIGDPSAGADDRLAFLETVLAARQKLSISYVGQSVQDNKKIPPSVVVSELYDYLNQAFAFPAGQSPEAFLLAEHPLHAFSPAYFLPAPAGRRVFSFSEANAEASRWIHAAHASPARPFCDAPLPEPTPARREIELSQLIDFWASPGEHFLRRRLGVRLGDKEESLSSEEPFDLDAREQYPIKQELVFGQLGFQAAASPEAFAARGTLPPGAIGEWQLRAIDSAIAPFARVVAEQLGRDEPKQTRDIKLLLADFTLSGRLTAIYGGRLVHFRCALLKAKDQIRAWIEHLALCAGAGPAETRLIGTDAMMHFSPVKDAAAQLEILCRAMAAGQARPLPFFPSSALAYAAAELKAKPDPLGEAHRRWRGAWKSPGEEKNSYFACCFPAGDPLDAEFVRLARLVCLPIVAHSETVAL